MYCKLYKNRSLDTKKCQIAQGVLAPPLKPLLKLSQKVLNIFFLGRTFFLPLSKDFFLHTMQTMMGWTLYLSINFVNKAFLKTQILKKGSPYCKKDSRALIVTPLSPKILSLSFPTKSHVCVCATQRRWVRLPKRKEMDLVKYKQKPCFVN